MRIHRYPIPGHGDSIRLAHYPMSMFSKSQQQSTAQPSKRAGFIKRLRQRINRGDSWLTYDLANLIPGGKIDASLLDELETHLVLADVGIPTTEHILEDLRRRVDRNELKDGDALFAALRGSMTGQLARWEQSLDVAGHCPFVMLVVGVNGVGKTTTIGKLAKKFVDQKQRVMLAAADTFRAAAIEQLQIWGERNDVPVVAQQAGADPAAVAFDALQAAKARKIDVLIVDTAGRLHTQHHLMDELKKVKRVLERLDPDAPQEVLLILDASIGQNALVQARQFHAALGITGLAITKLDGTAKGGILLAIAEELKRPIRWIGIGEQADDLDTFVAAEFVDALLKTPESLDIGEVS